MGQGHQSLLTEEPQNKKKKKRSEGKFSSFETKGCINDNLENGKTGHKSSFPGIFHKYKSTYSPNVLKTNFSFPRLCKFEGNSMFDWLNRIVNIDQNRSIYYSST